MYTIGKYKKYFTIALLGCGYLIYNASIGNAAKNDSDHNNDNELKAEKNIVIKAQTEKSNESDKASIEKSGDQKNSPDSKSNESESKTSVNPENFKYQVILGNPDSSVVVEEFSSLGCYGCMLFNKEIFPKIKKEFIDSNKIKYVVTELVHGAQDYHALLLLKLITKKYGNSPIGHQKYYELRDYLFQNQKEWMLSKDFKNILMEIGVKHGISKEEFLDAIKNQEIGKEITIGYMRRMINKKIDMTPVVTINDELCADDDQIEQMINDKLDENFDSTLDVDAVKSTTKEKKGDIAHNN